MMSLAKKLSKRTLQLFQEMLSKRSPYWTSFPSWPKFHFKDIYNVYVWRPSFGNCKQYLQLEEIEPRYKLVPNKIYEIETTKKIMKKKKMEKFVIPLTTKVASNQCTKTLRMNLDSLNEKNYEITPPEKRRFHIKCLGVSQMAYDENCKA